MSEFKVWLHIEECDDKEEYSEPVEPVDLTPVSTLEAAQALRDSIIDRYGG